VALKALERFPLAGLTGEVGALVRSAQVSADDRVLGIRVLARIPDGSLTSLRVALTAREPAVQIAAAEALGNSRSGRTPSTYRLSHVARRSSGDVAAACLAAQACLGYQPFMKEVLRRMRRLPEERHKAKVVAGLWGYGAKAVPDLARIARGSEGVPKQAALSCLRRIDAPEARAALDKLGGVRRDEPTAPVEPAGPFEQLLLDAASP